jgi:murein DD-endopeptidase MepM/ murein hydrolase activator NlpD
LFLSLLGGLCLLTFSPSFELTKVVFTSATETAQTSGADWKWPQKVKPGKLITLPYADDLPHFKINGVPFTKVPERQLQFAIASVYGGPVKSLSAVAEAKWSPLSGILWPPEVTVVRQAVVVDHAPLNSGSELRLPASVLKKLSSAEDFKKQRDRELLESALTGDAEALNLSCLKRPTDSIVTSAFARPRTLPSGRSYYHSGVDLRARTGAEIRSAKEGRVVFAGHMTVSGNNVILSHGGGLFSRYLHLSEIGVQLGERIPASEVVGLAGATGRVEAAHLHWEVIWKGQYADPLMLLEDWQTVCL